MIEEYVINKSALMELSDEGAIEAHYIYPIITLSLVNRHLSCIIRERSPPLWIYVQRQL